MVILVGIGRMRKDDDIRRGGGDKPIQVAKERCLGKRMWSSFPAPPIRDAIPLIQCWTAEEEFGMDRTIHFRQDSGWIPKEEAAPGGDAESLEGPVRFSPSGPGEGSEVVIPEKKGRFEDPANGSARESSAIGDNGDGHLVAGRLAIEEPTAE